MKLNLKMVASFLLLGVLAYMAGDVVQQAFGVPTLITQTAVVGSSFLFELWQGAFGNINGLVKNDVEPEIWRDWIAETIFKNNQFIERSVDVSDNVLSGKVVHLPQAGAPSGVEKNRTTLPASVTKRTDTDITYALDEYTTDPRLIQSTEELEASYNKRESVFKDDTSALRQLIAENVIFAWSATTAGKIKRTTGGANGDSAAAYTASATGVRYIFHQDDLLEMMTVADEDDIPEEGRYCMLSARAYKQVIQSLSKTEYSDFSKAYNHETGVLGKLHTWNIMKRSSVVTYDNAATPQPKAIGAAGAATDNDAAIFWHEDYVERALGEREAFEDQNNPQFYGTVMSFLARMGTRIRRADAKGVYALVQATPA